MKRRKAAKKTRRHQLPPGSKMPARGRRQLQHWLTLLPPGIEP